MIEALRRSFMRIFDYVPGEPQVEETAEQSQQPPSGDQGPSTSPEMPQQPQDNHTNPSEGGWTTVRNRTTLRHEGHPNPVSGADAHKSRGEHRLSKTDLLYSRLRAQSIRLRTVESDRDRHAGERETLERKYRQLLETHQSAVLNLRESQETCKGNLQEIGLLREKLRGTSALLDVRNQELKVAKTFLSKEDTFSASDVVQSVRDLNSEIMQAAAYLAESLPLKRLRTPSAEEVPEGPCKSAFVTLVLPPGPGDDVDVGSIELALQGFLAWRAAAVANAWGFSKEAGWCNRLYSKVRETEDRTIASNWRVLTRRTISHMDSNLDNTLCKLVNGMIKQLAELLAFCGIGDPVGNASVIHKHAAEKLEALYTTARNLNKMIGENFISEDLTVSVVRGGAIFDGKRMEDAYARIGPESGQRAVICTTDLGLSERREMRETGKVLLKPKVALFDS